MKSSDESLKDSVNTIAMVILGILFLLSPLIIIWLINTSPPSSTESSVTPAEAAQYEEYESYKSEQLLDENAEQEACIDQMDRDVERYGEWVMDTYDCAK